MRVQQSGQIEFDSGYGSVVEAGMEVWVIECSTKTGAVSPHYGRVVSITQKPNFASTLELDSGLVFDPEDESYMAYIHPNPVFAINMWLRAIGCHSLVADYESSYIPWQHDPENIKWLY